MGFIKRAIPKECMCQLWCFFPETNDSREIAVICSVTDMNIAEIGVSNITRKTFQSMHLKIGLEWFSVKATVV